jgi:hypothetical protein
MQARASPNPARSGSQIQPGRETLPTGSTSTCAQPTAPAATISSQRKKVLANVPFASIVATPVGGTVGGAAAVVDPGPPGAAQPGSSSAAVAVKRFSLSTGFAIGPPGSVATP